MHEKLLFVLQGLSFRACTDTVTLQALTQAGSNALHCHQDISLALSLLQPWDPEPGTKTKGTEDVAWGSRIWTDGVVGWDEAFPYLVLCFHMWSYVKYLHFAILALLFARTPKVARRVVLTMLHRTLRWRRDGSPGIKATMIFLKEFYNNSVLKKMY